MDSHGDTETSIGPASVCFHRPDPVGTGPATTSGIPASRYSGQRKLQSTKIHTKASILHLREVRARTYPAGKGKNLKNPEKSPILVLMNAVQVIEAIERLPEEEREKVVEFVRHLPNADTIAAMEEAEHPEKLERYESASDLFKKLGVE